MLRLIALILPLVVSSYAFAQGGGGGGVSVQQGGGGKVTEGFILGVRNFHFSDESSLGGDSLNDGASTLTRFDMQYNLANWYIGFGLFYESDTYGELQTDTIMGGEIELFIGNLFFKYLAGNIEQAYSERSFAVRKGSFTAQEFGIRAALFGGWSFYEISLHMRTKNINTEDDRTMASPFTESQTMPMLGIGFSI